MVISGRLIVHAPVSLVQGAELLLFRVSSRTLVRIVPPDSDGIAMDVADADPRSTASAAALEIVDAVGPAGGGKDGRAGERVGGLRAEFESLRELLCIRAAWPTGLACPSGVLLYGPPGTGKTTLVRSLAAQMNLPFSYIRGPELYSPYPGESEVRLRQRFSALREAVLLRAVVAPPQQYKQATGLDDSIAASNTGLLFIDELDALCPARTAHGSVRVQLIGHARNNM